MKINNADNNKNPLIDDNYYDKNRLPLFARIISVVTLIICGSLIPILSKYVVNFIDGFMTGSYNQYTTTYNLMYVAFVLTFVLTLVGVILSCILIFKNKRRHCAIALYWSGWTCGISSTLNVMLFGIKPESVFFILIVVSLIFFKSYIDPTLAQERKVQDKLKLMQLKDEYKKGTIGLSKKKTEYAEMNFFNVFWLFFIFSFLGYVFEIVWHMTVDDPGVYQERAGLLFGPFSPIYGVGAILINFICNRIHDKNPLVIFLVCAALGGMLEYAASLFLELSFGVKSWDYSHLPFNIQGRVSLRFFVMWGVLGLIYTKFLFKGIIRLINKIHWRWRYGITIVVSGFMLINIVMTLQSLDCWYERNVGKTMNTPIEQFYNKNFNDEFMQNRFQNMKMETESSTRVLKD